jgi:hypothetical protein
MSKVMAKELSEISITNAGRERPFTFLSVAHGSSKLDELEFLVTCYGLRWAREKARITTFRRGLDPPRVRASSRLRRYFVHR